VTKFGHVNHKLTIRKKRIIEFLKGWFTALAELDPCLELYLVGGCYQECEEEDGQLLGSI
jgi:hypothetical protein